MFSAPISANANLTIQPQFGSISSQITSVYNVRYDFNPLTNSNKWDLVTNPNEAIKIDPQYSLASIDDLHEYIAACGYVFEGVVRVVEGEFVWSEYYDKQGEHFCEYVHVTI
ncbi:hypothetical protein EEL31_10560 [Brevibacillus laterosporus]|nr:hypothetical protein EEL31_10560 [Brevibacillus laterosporus]